MSKEKPVEVTMYSTSWCPDCVRAKFVLKKLNVLFVEIDIDKDEAGRQIVLEHNDSQRVVPTIFFPDGSVLVEPANQVLREKVKILGLGQEGKS